MTAKRTPPPRGPQLDLADELCVALVNTAGARPDNRQQGVESYADFVTWSQAVGTVSAPEAERLRRRAAERPRAAEAAFALVAKSRTALANSFLAAQRQEPADECPFPASLSSSAPAGDLEAGRLGDPVEPLWV